MTFEFFSRNTVKGRKAHTCGHCRKPIEIGEAHFYCAGKFDGDMVVYREHHECERAWSALNTELRNYRDDGEGFPFLADDDEIDQGEREWLHEKFPAVAARIWTSTDEVTA